MTLIKLVILSTLTTQGIAKCKGHNYFNTPNNPTSPNSTNNPNNLRNPNSTNNPNNLSSPSSTNNPNT